MTFFHLENPRFSRVLRTRDRLLRSGRHFIHSLLGPRGCPMAFLQTGIGISHDEGPPA